MATGDLIPWPFRALRRAGDDRMLDAFREEMDALHRNIDRLFTGAWAGEPTLLSESWTKQQLVPRLDVTEDDKAFRVTVELPGMTDKDVNVSVADRTLTIRGEKKEEKEKKDKDIYRSERAYGSFRRVVEFPAEVEAAKIAASFKNGVLSIDVPKTKEAQAKAKQIPVKGE